MAPKKSISVVHRQRDAKAKAQPSTSQAVKQRPYTLDNQWSSYRDIITHLYRDKNWPLKDVKWYVELQEGFQPASERMWKYRINQWGLEKKLKESEVLEIIRQKKQRDASGQDSVIVVHGRVVPFSKVEKYLKRKDSKLQAKLAEDSSLEIGSYAGGIVLRTPSPDPAVAFSINVALPAPGTAKAAEDIARLLLLYYEGGVDGPLWVRSQDGFLHSSSERGAATLVDEWHRDMGKTVKTLSSSQSTKGWDSLHTAFDRLRNLVRMDDCLLVPRLLTLAVDINSYGFPELTKELYAHILQLLRIIRGPGHPMTLLFQRIQSLPFAEYPAVFELAVRRVLAFFENVPDSELTLVELTQFHMSLLSQLPDSENVTKRTRSTFANAMTSVAYRGMVKPPSAELACQFLAQLVDLDVRGHAGEAEKLLQLLAQWLNNEHSAKNPQPEVKVEDNAYEEYQLVLEKASFELSASAFGAVDPTATQKLEPQEASPVGNLLLCWITEEAEEGDGALRRKLAIYIPDKVASDGEGQFQAAWRSKAAYHISL